MGKIETTDNLQQVNVNNSEKEIIVSITNNIKEIFISDPIIFSDETTTGEKKEDFFNKIASEVI